MARFRQYRIKYDDTVQFIAQKELNDISRWVEIIDHNRLVYPFIVATPEEKTKNINGLRTYGDVIMIPIVEDLTELDPTDFSPRDIRDIYNISLGSDLRITYPNTNDLYLDSFDGNLDTVQGVENLSQSLILRINTERGSLLMHPDYGSDVNSHLGKKGTRENAIIINHEIERTILSDPRVEACTLQEYRISESTYAAVFSIRPIGLEQSFAFVLEGRRGGGITLRDEVNLL